MLVRSVLPFSNPLSVTAAPSMRQSSPRRWRPGPPGCWSLRMPSWYLRLSTYGVRRSGWLPRWSGLKFLVLKWPPESSRQEPFVYFVTWEQHGARRCAKGSERHVRLVIARSAGALFWREQELRSRLPKQEVEGSSWPLLQQSAATCECGAAQGGGAARVCWGARGVHVVCGISCKGIRASSLRYTQVPWVRVLWTLANDGRYQAILGADE